MEDFHGTKEHYIVTLKHLGHAIEAEARDFRRTGLLATIATVMTGVTIAGPGGLVGSLIWMTLAAIAAHEANKARTQRNTAVDTFVQVARTAGVLKDGEEEALRQKPTKAHLIFEKVLANEWERHEKAKKDGKADDAVEPVDIRDAKSAARDKRVEQSQRSPTADGAVKQTEQNPVAEPTLIRDAKKAAEAYIVVDQAEPAPAPAPEPEAEPETVREAKSKSPPTGRTRIRRT